MRDLRDAPDYRAPSPTGRGLSFGGAREGGRRNIMYTFIFLDSDNTASTGNTALFFFRRHDLGGYGIYQHSRRTRTGSGTGFKVSGSSEANLSCAYAVIIPLPWVAASGSPLVVFQNVHKE